MGNALASLSICFDVVPDDTRLWNPDMAPHATVMNSAGKRYPTLVSNDVNPGRFISGITTNIPINDTKRRPYRRKEHMKSRG